MKSNRKIFYGFIAMLAFLYSCTTTRVVSGPPGKVPPGQMKKATGSQSAKPYAPGQVKKSTGSQSAKPYAPGQVKKNGGSNNGNGNSQNNKK